MKPIEAAELVTVLEAFLRKAWVEHRAETEQAARDEGVPVEYLLAEEIVVLLHDRYDVPFELPADDDVLSN